MRSSMTVALLLAAALVFPAAGSGNRAGTPRPSCMAQVLRFEAQLDRRYRFPSEQDIFGGWQYIREEHSSDASCEVADFNRDGLTDFASVILARDSNLFAVAFVLSGRSGSYRVWIPWKEEDARFEAQEVRLAVLRPEDKGELLWCAGEPRKAAPIRLEYPMLEYSVRQNRWKRDSKAQRLVFAWDERSGTVLHETVCDR